jgi:hypothetical protein
MEKATEIYLLKQLADQLGDDSYIGPWLQDQIPFVERDMRCDYPVMISYRAAREERERESRLAMEERDRIIANAKREADTIVQNAISRAEAVIKGAARDMRKALSLLE